MTTASNYIIKFKIGDDFLQAIQATTIVANVETAINLTGYTITGNVHPAGTSTVFATITGTITDAANGWYTLSMSDTITSTFVATDKYTYSVQFTTGGFTQTFFEGDVIAENRK